MCSTFFTQAAGDLISKHISTMGNLKQNVYIDTIPQCFPSAEAYHVNSVASMIKLQSLPLQHILKNSPSSVVLEFAIVLFLERSTVHDWKLRLEYLQSLVNSVLDSLPFQCREDVTTLLQPFLHSFGTLFSSQLMVNLKNEFRGVASTRFGECV